MDRARDIVLVVDDGPATLGLLNQALEAAGYTVLVAQDGAAALALVERVTPDIVLMDAVMPGLDGFETCRRMKLLPSLAAVPIVFMTGLTETEHVIRGLEVGGVDYVTKPVAPDEVIARIQVHLANARLTRSAQVALDAAGRFLLAVDRAGRVLWSTPQATRLLEEAGAGPAGLPAGVAAWIQRCTSDAASFPPTNMTDRHSALAASAGWKSPISARSPRTNCCCGWSRARVRQTAPAAPGCCGRPCA